MRMKPSCSTELILSEFRINLGETMSKIGSYVTPKRGRPLSGAGPAKKLHKPIGHRPTQDVQRDQMSHWPEHSDKQRCKNGGCNKYLVIKCNKCNVHLCLNKHKNCFIEFHQ